MSFKGFSIFSFSGHFVQWSRTIFSNFGRGSPKEYFYEIILKLSHWPRRCYLQIFLFLALAAILFSGAEQGTFYEIILKSGH